MSGMFRKVTLYVRTILRMKPSMLIARLRGLRKVPETSYKSIKPLSIVIPVLDCDSSYVSRFDVDALFDNVFFLLGEQHTVDLDQWKVPEASHLWNFNLHYFEYCIPLAARFSASGDVKDIELFKRLVYSWIEHCEYPNGDAWHPYTISLRLVNWLVCLNLFGSALISDSSFMEAIGASMYRQYQHLLANQEKHLLANHYFENLKTLVICALMFEENEVLSTVEDALLRQLEEQVLSDGVHFERSLMYHKLCIEGLFRVELAYRSAGILAPGLIFSKVKLMIDAVASIERGMGKTPFFNDAADGVAKECCQLIAACRKIYVYEADSSLTAFPKAGFFKLYNGEVSVVFFAGCPGPSYMLGHSHCDLLSFEASISGKPVLVNSGTYAYQTNLRDYFRSTSAHNTVLINGNEQMEFWAEHRVARSSNAPSIIRNNTDSICARFQTIDGVDVTRSVTVLNDSIIIEDSFGEQVKSANEFLHFKGQEFDLSKVEVLCVQGKSTVADYETPYSEVMGVLEKKRTVCIQLEDVSKITYKITY